MSTKERKIEIAIPRYNFEKLATLQKSWMSMAPDDYKKPSSYQKSHYGFKALR